MNEQVKTIKIEFNMIVTKYPGTRCKARLSGSAYDFVEYGHTQQEAKDNLVATLKEHLMTWEPPTIYGVGSSNFICYPHGHMIGMVEVPSGTIGSTTHYETAAAAKSSARNMAAQELSMIDQDGDPLKGDPKLELLQEFGEKLAHLEWYCWQHDYVRLRNDGKSDVEAHRDAKRDVSEAVRSKFLH